MSIPRAEVEPQDLAQDGAPLEPRAVRLTADVVERFGATPQGQKCKMIINGNQNHGSYNHSADCRQRLEKCMGEDADYAHRVLKQQERVEKYMEQYMIRKMA